MTRRFKAELTERKALILSRFTVLDAMSFCGFEAHARFGHSDICPSCRKSGLNFVISGKGLAGPSLTDAPDVANSVICSHCGFSGDAAAFVAAARGFGHLNLALDAIEAWLDAECRQVDRLPSDGRTGGPVVYCSPLSRPLRVPACSARKKRILKTDVKPLPALPKSEADGPRKRIITLFKKKADGS